MAYGIFRHIHPLKGGLILSGTEQPLAASINAPSTGSPTDHTHPNLNLLNSLNFDLEQRLRTNTNIINPPLEQKDW